MAKFYVQSGNLRTIVQAESSRKAAIWAVHQAMQQVLPVDEDCSPVPAQPSLKGHDEPMQVIMLTKRISVSQRGFDRADASVMSTFEIINDWNQMVTTLDRLERMLHHAA